MSLIDKIRSMIFESDTPSFDEDNSESYGSLSTNALVDDPLKSYFQESTTEISTSIQRSFSTSVDSGVSSLVEKRLDNVIQEVLNNHKIKTTKRRKKIINKILSSNISSSFLENSRNISASHQKMSGQMSSSQTSEKPEKEIDDLDHQIAELMRLREEKLEKKSSNEKSVSKTTSADKSSTSNNGKLSTMIDPKETITPDSTVRALVKSFGPQPQPEVQKVKPVTNKRTYSEVTANKSSSDINKKSAANDDIDHHVAEKKIKDSSNSPKDMEELRQMLAFPQLQKEPVLKKSDPKITSPNKEMNPKKSASRNLITSESERSEKPLIIDEGDDHENDNHFEHSTMQKSASKESRIQQDSGVHDLQSCNKVVVVSSDNGENTTLPKKKKRSCRKVNKTIDYDPSSSSDESDHESNDMDLRIESSEGTNHHNEANDDSQIQKLIQLCHNEEKDQRPLRNGVQFPQMKFSKLKEKNIYLKSCLANVTLLADLNNLDKEEELQILNAWPTISSTRRSVAYSFIQKIAKWIQFMCSNIISNQDYTREAKKWQLSKLLNANEFLQTSTEHEINKSKFWERPNERLPKYNFSSFSEDNDMLMKDVENISDINELMDKPNHVIIYVGVIAQIRIRRESSEMLGINVGSAKTKHTALFSRSLYYWDTFLQANQHFKKLNNKNLSSAVLQHYDCSMKFVNFMCSTMTEEEKFRILKTNANNFFEHAPESIFLYFYYNARIRPVVINDPEDMVQALETQAFRITESMIINNKSDISAIENRINYISKSLSEFFENFERRHILEVERNQKSPDQQQNADAPLKRRRSVHRFDDWICETSPKVSQKQRNDNKTSSSSTLENTNADNNSGSKSDHEYETSQRKTSYQRSPPRFSTTRRSDLPANLDHHRHEISKNYKEKLRIKHNPRRKFTSTSRTGKQISKRSPDRPQHDRSLLSKGRSLIKNYPSRKTDKNSTRDRSPTRENKHHDEPPSSSKKYSDYHHSNVQSSSQQTPSSSKSDADRNQVSVSIESQQQCMSMMMNGMKMMNDLMKQLSEYQMFQARK